MHGCATILYVFDYVFPMFAASPSPMMEAAFGRLRTGGRAAFGCPPTVLESVIEKLGEKKTWAPFSNLNFLFKLAGVCLRIFARFCRLFVKFCQIFGQFLPEFLQNCAWYRNESKCDLISVVKYIEFLW